jgi:hypothetical protein
MMANVLLGIEKEVELQKLRLGALDFICESARICQLLNESHTSIVAARAKDSVDTLRELLLRELTAVEGEYFKYKHLQLEEGSLKKENKEGRLQKVSHEILKDLILELRSNWRSSYWQMKKFQYLEDAVLPILLEKCKALVGDKVSEEEYEDCSLPPATCCLCGAASVTEVICENKKAGAETIPMCAACIGNKFNIRIALSPEQKETLTQLLLQQL